jgi:SAM-dependent methyltransferase
MSGFTKKFKSLARYFKRKADNRFGAVIDEVFWRLRGRKWARECLSPEVINHPHREFLLKRIESHRPFESILEVGCASGPNLYRLAKKFPDIKIFGTDINKKAVKLGRDWFAGQGMGNVEISVSRAEDLRSFLAKSIDIVLTDAALIYISPDRIRKVLKETFRVANKSLIFNEWNYDLGKEPLYRDHWIYNWKELLKEFITEESIIVTRIPKGLWAGEWEEFGAVIEVRLKS